MAVFASRVSSRSNTERQNRGEEVELNGGGGNCGLTPIIVIENDHVISGI